MWSGLLAGLAWIVPQSICDVDVLREDGSGRVATVVQDSAVGWDTTIYPHCVFADEPHFMAIDTDSSKTLSPTELNDDGAPAPTERAHLAQRCHCNYTSWPLTTPLLACGDDACLRRRWQLDVHGPEL